MLIQTLETPNPHSLKFVPPCTVRGDEESAFFLRHTGDAQRSPFAERLFEIEQVWAVFLGSDFITVTKDPQADWYALKPAILGVMVEFFTQNKPLIVDTPESAAPKIATLITGILTITAVVAGQWQTIASRKSAYPTNMEDPIVKEIVALIDDRVRPAVAQDGGDIVFSGFHEGIVYLELQGSCSGCPSSRVTLKNGVENMLKYYIPEVLEVRAVS